MEIVVKSDHHWFKDSLITITIDSAGHVVDTHTVAKESAYGASTDGDSAFATMAARLFSLLGVGPDRLSIIRGSLTLAELYTATHTTPVPEDLTFVWLSRCGCNSGYCPEVTEIQELKKVATLGDVFARWGSKETHPVVGTWYEYSKDGVLFVRRMTALPSLGHSTGKEGVGVPEVVMTPGRTYISCLYAI